MGRKRYPNAFACETEEFQLGSPFCEFARVVAHREGSSLSHYFRTHIENALKADGFNEWLNEKLKNEKGISDVA